MSTNNQEMSTQTETKSQKMITKDVPQEKITLITNSGIFNLSTESFFSKIEENDTHYIVHERHPNISGEYIGTYTFPKTTTSLVNETGDWQIIRTPRKLNTNGHQFICPFLKIKYIHRDIMPANIMKSDGTVIEAKFAMCVVGYDHSFKTMQCVLVDFEDNKVLSVIDTISSFVLVKNGQFWYDETKSDTYKVNTTPVLMLGYGLFKCAKESTK